MAWSLRGQAGGLFGDQGGDDAFDGDGVLEKDIEGDNILGGKLDVFVEQGAADGGLVHADHLRQVGAGQRAQERALAGFQKALLAFDQGHG